MSSYRPSVVTFSLIFTRFRDIAAFVLQQATFSRTPPLVSPKFPHVPLEEGESLCYKSEGVGLIVCGISFQDFQPIHSPPTSQTDGQTTCDRKTALCTKVHCAVKSVNIFG